MRGLCLTGLALALTFGLAICGRDSDPYPVAEASLSQIADDLAAEKTTSVALTRAYIERIKAQGSTEINLTADALVQADASDKRRGRGAPRGRLDGVPVLLKDNIDGTASEIAQRLRAAGAVILGKTHTATKSVAAPFAAAAIDIAAAGSSADGVVTLQPTVALISRQGIMPVNLSLETAGPVARDVRDAAALLTVLAGRADYAQLLSTQAFQDTRIGVYRGSAGFNPQSQPLFDAALAVLEAQGARLVNIPDAVLPDLAREYALIMAHDIGDGIEEARRRAGAEGYAKVMTDYEVTAIVGPDDVMRGPNDPPRPSLGGLAALAGYPVLSVPMGRADGRAVGLSLVGPPWSEDLLLAMGYIYTQAARGKEPAR